MTMEEQAFCKEKYGRKSTVNIVVEEMHGSSASARAFTTMSPMELTGSVRYSLKGPLMILLPTSPERTLQTIGIGGSITLNETVLLQ